MKKNDRDNKDTKKKNEREITKKKERKSER